MSKVKGSEEKKWKHAIGPLTLADHTVEEGEPQSVYHPNPKQIQISHLMFLCTGFMLFIHVVNNSDAKQKSHQKNEKKKVSWLNSSINL